ncbi:hypothetical protein AMTRI_Chr10g5490 [Amborella trichopoda]|uniref:WAT1-related protein n=1 Tax=Amborella trichopoda TaxID=13333 RepID=U5D7N3_AMBTC|nr:WAT1-related protein At1g21890 isoform X2 [Amborella trichopoda]ERN18250.1 hypothetical protein AMTR_s00055p00109980 [Amborella trichopoda]|eukprot:XP_006856783.1 WAT1-related protein At1g21890 isoform X2 [Amborella trichopoda]
MEGYVPILAQVVVQSLIAGMYLLTTAAFANGMSPFVFVTYRGIVATLFLAPFALLLERETRPPLSIKTLCQIFLLALLGIAITQNGYLTAIALTSSTFVSTSANLIPAVAFLMAIFLRLEKFDIKHIRGKAKIFGTVTCVAGATIMTLVKGPVLTSVGYLKANGSLASLLGVASFNPSSDWTLGIILIFLSILGWSAWLNYQAWAFNDYPAPISLTVLMCFMGIFPSALIALLVADSTAWRLKWDMHLFTYIYSGVLCTAFQFFVQSWCIKIKGPVFPAAFYPVCTVIVSILEPIVFHVHLHVGSVVGIVTVIAGLYCVLWGKAKDENVTEIRTQESPNLKEKAALHLTIKEPLLK